MSYILDALKKLEKERKRGRIPGLNEQDSIVYHSQKKSAWPYMLVALSFLIAGIGIAWFSIAPSKDNILQDMAATTPKMPSQGLSGQPKSLPQTSAPLQTVTARPVAAMKSDDTQSGEKDDKPSNEMKEKDDLNKMAAAENRQKKSEEAKPAPEPVQTEPRNETPPDPVVRKQLYKFSELPPSVRESLKKLFKISAYMYSSTPSERMVRINDQMMREGQEMEPGIRIEEIVSDGVILSYMKFRFIVSLK